MYGIVDIVQEYDLLHNIFNNIWLRIMKENQNLLILLIFEIQIH